MHPARKQRLIIVAIIVIGASAAAALIANALKQNLNLFYEPTRIVNGEAPIGRKIRVGGMVLENSLTRVPDSLTVQFVVTDYEAEVTVEFTGILPDMFTEEAGTVATGVLTEEGLFVAEQVLAKHDETYMPPEVAAALKNKPPSY
ncbi:MAG: cytochrome c maturation protein CcmE [Cellvibrionales bacterium]|jgi:cytochrome c-type biogenesis protein CcmE|nr:cytochrome c maturation protein CcmE [Cellvibrionales bacterium]MBT5923241.1 cytochrome c maturation protein CcmE [Cellvibrionales bacterium]MBT6578858.1 cytochrome c maturation protein CcmE [Cellvibrionales bacterium]